MRVAWLVALASCVTLAHAITIQLEQRIPLGEAEFRTTFNRSYESASHNQRATEPLGGDIDRLGLYWMRIAVGTPPQNFVVHLDTGSSDLLIYDTTCDACSLIARRFDATQSSSFAAFSCGAPGYTCRNRASVKCRTQECEIARTYSDGTWINGRAARDIITLATFSTTATVGLITSAAPKFEPPQIDGIFGLARSQLSATQSPSVLADFRTRFPSQWGDWFSLCLGHLGGYAQFGEAYDERDFAWTPQVDTRGYYGVRIVRMQVRTSPSNAATLDISSATWGATTATLDSGSAMMYLSTPLYAAFIKRLQAYCGAAFYAANWPGICGGGSTLLAGRYATITAAQFATFPTLEVFLSGLATPIQLAPFDYLVPVSAHTTVGQTGYYYLGVRSLESRASVVYLGDVFMRNRIVMFDNVNNRVGFAAATSACGR